MSEPKIVMLPGLDGTGLLCKPILKALPKNHKVSVVTYPVDKLMDYNELTELVLSQLPDEDFILIAESFSGFIAYQIGLKKLKHLKSIVFVATFLTNPRPFLLGVSKLLPMALLLKASIPDFIAKRFLLGSSINSETINLFKQALKKVDSKVISYRLKLIQQMKPPLETCYIESIYIQASNDKLVPAKAIDPFMKLFVNLSVQKIKGPHFLLQSKPVECVSVINSIKFMQSV